MKALQEGETLFPLYDYANHGKIHSLTINEYLPDAVVPTGVNEAGESVYFFYFADIPMVHEENVALEDFVVTINGELIDFSSTDGEPSSFNPVDYAFTFVVLGVIALMIWRSRRRAKARQSFKEGK